MKHLTVLLLVVLIGSVAYSQMNIVAAVPRVDRTGTSMSAKAYTSSTDDTTQAYAVRPWETTTLLLSAADSCSFAVYYLPSVDGVNFKDRVLIDSLSSAANGGAVKAFALPAGVVDFAAVKFDVVSQGTFRLGTSSATYTARIVQKRYQK